MLDNLASQEAPLDETSTIRGAQELFRSSWVNNPGRKVDDILFFDALPPESQFHLIECAYAAERLLDEFAGENLDLLTYNCAVTLYEAYHKHPASSVPDLPWETSPADVKNLWMKFARDFMAVFCQTKHLPRWKGWLELRVQKKL